MILFERYDKMQAVSPHFAEDVGRRLTLANEPLQCLVTKGESYANKFGTFRHDDMIGKEYGSRVSLHSSRRSKVHALVTRA